MAEKKATKKIKSTDIVPLSKTDLYFLQLKESKLIKGFEKKIKEHEDNLASIRPDEIPAAKTDLSALKKKVEAERAIINDPLNAIKRKNQALFVPMTEKINDIVSALTTAYNEHVRLEREKQRKAQEEIDRKAAEERKRLEAEREAEVKKGNSPPPEVDIIAPTVRPPAYEKTVCRKDISVEVTGKLEFIRHAVETGDVELLDCIEITKTAPIKNKARRDPGKVIIPGVSITYTPDLQAWLGE